MGELLSREYEISYSHIDNRGIAKPSFLWSMMQDAATVHAEALGFGPETLGAFVLNRPVIGELLGGIIGFIPNCAASVVLTTLYLEGAMSGGAMLSGLLVGSGVGLLVLLRMNRDWRDNLVTAGLLYAGGVIFGLLADVLHIV